MVLNTQQEALYDTPGTAVQAYAYILRPAVVFEAPVVSYTEHAGAYVAIEVGTPTVGALSDIQEEMTLYIHVGTGVRNGGSQRVRGLDIGNDTILIGRAAAGTGEGQICGIVTDAVVTVYDDYRPFIKAPYITAIPTPVQYKDESLYPGHDLAQPPVAHAGIDRLIVTDAADAEVELDAGLSFAVRAGATITAYDWEIEDGSIETGAVDEETLTVTFPRGYRWIRLTVTDSNGTDHVTHRLIVVASPDECTAVRIPNMAHNPYGNSLSLRLDSAVLTSTLPPRAKVLVAERENYHNTLIGYNERFSGWLKDENNSLEDARRKLFTVELEVEDTAAFLQRNNLFPQSLNAIDSVEVGGWFRMRNANIDRMMHYILHWHTNILSCVGFTWSGEGDTYPFPALTTSGGSFWQNIDRLARAFGHELTASFTGSLSIVPDPHVLPDADQAAEFSLPTQRPTGTMFHFSRSRYQSFTLPTEITPQSYWLNALGIVATNDLENVVVVGSIAPGNAPGFGTGAASRTDFLVTSQDELNVWAANQFAAKDGATLGELTLIAINPATIIDPSTRGFVTVDLPAYLVERYDLGGRWTIERIEYTYSDYNKTATYYLKKEVVAVKEARTLPQIEDESLDQAWTGFDTSIVPTTGQIVQGFTNMALTQAELEQTLSKTRLKVYLSQFETDDTGNSGEDGGSGDPTVPTDPNDPESIFLANSYKNGGYYYVAKKIDDFLDAFGTFYTAVSAETNVETLLTQYVDGYLLDVPTGAAAAWADYIVNSPDTTLPTLSVTNRETLTSYMYCLDNAKGGLSQYIIATIDTDFWDRWNFMAACISVEQVQAWYDIGVTTAFNAFTGYFCYLYPPFTLELDTTEIHAQTLVVSTPTMNWGAALDNNRRLVQVRMSGFYEDATYIKDGLYVYTKSNGSIASTPLAYGARATLNSSNITATPVGALPGYNPEHVYLFSVTMSKAAFQNWASVAYRLQDTRSPGGSGVGSFAVTFTDLGRYDY